MSAPFENRRFVVTGGAGGIGRACARQLLDGSAEVLLVTFLCSDGASYLTGQTLNVDAGAHNA